MNLFNANTIYRISTYYLLPPQDGTLRVSEVKGGPLLQSDLVSDDSFIVDNGSWGIWVWVGKRASRKERTEAMRNAQGFIKKKGKRYIHRLPSACGKCFLCYNLGSWMLTGSKTKHS